MVRPTWPSLVARRALLPAAPAAARVSRIALVSCSEFTVASPRRSPAGIAHRALSSGQGVLAAVVPSLCAAASASDGSTIDFSVPDKDVDEFCAPVPTTGIPGLKPRHRCVLGRDAARVSCAWQPHPNRCARRAPEPLSPLARPRPWFAGTTRRSGRRTAPCRQRGRRHRRVAWMAHQRGPRPARGAQPRGTGIAPRRMPTRSPGPRLATRSLT